MTTVITESRQDLLSALDALDTRLRWLSSWTVHNANHLREKRDGMKVGDGVMFYHSNTKVPGIVGLATVASEAYPDDTQFDPRSDYYDPKATREEPRWMLVDVAFERKLRDTISLDEIKLHADALGEGFPLTARGNRLSILPVTAAQWKLLLSLEKH